MTSVPLWFLSVEIVAVLHAKRNVKKILKNRETR